MPSDLPHFICRSPRPILKPSTAPILIKEQEKEEQEEEVDEDEDIPEPFDEAANERLVRVESVEVFCNLKYTICE